MELIWDFDGTLFDTYPLMARCLQRALLDEGVPADLAEIRRQMAVSLGTAFAHFSAGEAVIARYKRYVEQSGPRAVAPFPGAEDVCARVVQQGGHNHLFTHRGASARWYLRESGLDRWFTCVVTDEDRLPRKPAPDGVLRILERSGQPRESFVMIGDREIDILAAHAAGIRACRFAPQAEEVSTEAEYRLREYREFFDVVKEERGT